MVTPDSSPYSPSEKWSIIEEGDLPELDKEFAKSPKALGKTDVQNAHVNDEATWVEQIQRKIRVRGSTPENAPRIRAGMEKKEQKPELKKNQTRRCYAEKTSIFFQTTDRHPPGARRETTEVKTRKC